VPDEVVKLLVIGALGTVSAVAAHRNIAIYHDGLRTSVDDVAAGRRTRTDLGAYGYRI